MENNEKNESHNKTEKITEGLLARITNIKRIGRDKLILLLFAGILLIGSSYVGKVEKNQKVEKKQNITISQSSYQTQIKNEIKNMIESIEGVKNVNVMITFKSGNEKILQVDKEENDDREGKKSSKTSTVILDGSGEDSPYIIKEVYPQIEGVAITASGLQDVEKINEITNMINALFNIPVHKISIINNN